MNEKNKVVLALKEVVDVAKEMGMEVFAPSMNVVKPFDDIIIRDKTRTFLFTIREDGCFSGGLIPTSEFNELMGEYMLEKARHSHGTHLGWWIYSKRKYAANHDFSAGEIKWLFQH